MYKQYDPPKGVSPHGKSPRSRPARVYIIFPVHVVGPTVGLSGVGFAALWGHVFHILLLLLLYRSRYRIIVVFCWIFFFSVTYYSWIVVYFNTIYSCTIKCAVIYVSTSGFRATITAALQCTSAVANNSKSPQAWNLLFYPVRAHFSRKKWDK